MSNFVKNFIEKERDISIFDILIIIFSFTLIRTFFENFSNPDPNGFFTPFYSVFSTYFLFYVSTFLFLLLLIFWLTKIEMKKVAVLGIFCMPVICLPPIIDLVITRGHGLCMMYIIQEPKNLLFDFLNFFGSFNNCGITTGIKIEVLIICSVLFVFIYQITKKIVKAFLGAILGYGLIFANLALPSLIMTPFYISNNSIDKTFFFDKLFKNSLLNSIHTFNSLPSNAENLYIQQAEFFMSRCHWIMIVISLLLILYLAYRSLWNAWVRNLRPERILYYSLLAIFGMSISYKVNGSLPVFTLPDILAFIVFFTLITLNWCLAVIINDIEDVEIDKISNPDRPLITKEFNIKQFKTIGIIILFLILTGAPLLNYPVFVFLILFQFVYYIYSKKPLYLKKYFFTASPLLAFNALLIAMAGFFLISANQKFLSFPFEYTWFILIGFSIFANIKDFKDTEGDRQEGIKTLPVVFGQEKSKKITTFLVILFLMLFSFYKQSLYLFFSSFLISAAAYIFLNKTSFKEIRLFYLLYLYMIIIMLIL